MSRYIVLRETGAAVPLLIDKTTMTVTRMDPEAARALAPLTEARSRTAPFAGLDYAISIEYRSTAPARMLYAEEKPLAG